MRMGGFIGLGSGSQRWPYGAGGEDLFGGGIVVNLPDPTTVSNGYELTQSDGTTSRKVYSDGADWRDKATDAVISPWWLPYGAALHVDVVNSRFYWNGVEKALSDLTDLGDGAYSLAYNSVGSAWTGIETIASEVIFGPAPSNPSGSFGGWWRTNSNQISLEPTGTSADEWRWRQRITSQAGSSAAATSDYNSSGLTSFAGVNRSIFCVPASDYSQAIWSNSKMVTATGVNFALTQPTGKTIYFGAQPATGTKATNTAFRKYTMWPRRLSEAFMRRANNVSTIRPLHLIGDSFLTHGRIMMRIKASAESDGNIVGWSQDGVGSTTLADQAARFAATPTAWSSTLIIMDGASELDGAASVAAIQSMVAKLPHNDWVYVEPNPINPIGDSRRTDWDTAQATIQAFCGADHFIPTLDEMIALDTSNEVDGLWGDTMTSDLTHPTNPVGYDALSGIIYDGLVAKGLL